MKLQIEPSLRALLDKVNTFFQERNIKAYLVGGFVRDLLLERLTADIDIAVMGDALSAARELADNLCGNYVSLDEINRVARIMLPETQWHVDLSSIEGDIKQDLARRDFTIDTLAIDLVPVVMTPEKAELIDLFGGEKDLKKGLIRATSGTVFESDSARLLRAVRLSAELGLKIEPDTAELISKNANLLKTVAGERIRDELLRILAVYNSGDFVRQLDELGLLTSIIPELAPAKGVEQPIEHVWDVFNHSVETVRTVDFLLRRGRLEYAGEKVLTSVPWSERLERHFNQGVSVNSIRSSILKIAALLHDNAKPETKTLEESGRVRFLGHQIQGEEKAATVLERLRFSSKEIGLVGVMIRHHLRPVQMGHDGMPTSRAIYRFFRDTGDAGIDVLFLSLADHLAARGNTLDFKAWKQHCALVDYVLTQRFQQEDIVIPPKLINGNDLINIFKMSPGPKIGEILEEVREAQAAGEIKSREEALSYVRNTLLYKE